MAKRVISHFVSFYLSYAESVVESPESRICYNYENLEYLVKDWEIDCVNIINENLF